MIIYFDLFIHFFIYIGHNMNIKKLTQATSNQILKLKLFI